MNPVGTAIVIAPGGGYVGVAINHEGRQIADWLNTVGIGAFVLRYRVGPSITIPLNWGMRSVPSGWYALAPTNSESSRIA